jgi:S-adenosylmethionine:tRNA ribosyltransferase-isomerase
LNLSAFDYRLPREAIAQQPLPRRDDSRLMLLERRTGAVRHHVFRDLPDLLSPGDLLVVNRSRVFPARLLGRRATGGSVEILLLRPQEAGVWEALVRPGARLRPGTRVDISEGLCAWVESGPQGSSGARLLRLEARDGDVAGAVERLGTTPLPPYIKRAATDADRDRYQTVYARESGSVAAPTAGLHFTSELLACLEERGIDVAELVLHVGPGTFLPVRVDRVEEHRVDPEPYVVPEAAAAAVDRTRAGGGRVVAVGTTSARVLETVARDDGTLVAGSGETGLTIVPPFRFRTVDALLTNFHLPRSSLLMLVCAFGGREYVLRAYDQAVRSGYRFYSYGDAMLLV